MPDVIQIAIQATDLASKVIGGVGDSLDKLDKSADSAEKKLKLFGLTTDQIGSKMSSVGKIATIGLTVPIAGISVAAIKAASDLNETANKIDTLFGAASDEIKKFADTAATSLGQSKKQALDAAATFAVFGKAAGLAGQDLVKFSEQNVTLAADMASFFNTSPEEAITAIGAAFRGESEPIRRYGVLLDDASLKQQALRMGLIKTTTEALQPQQRVLAAQALIMQQTTAAAGDFAKTSGGLANQTRILEAQFQDVVATLGQSLLPVAVKVASAANDLLTAFNNLDQPTKDLIVGFGLMAAAAGPVLTIGGKLIGMFGSLASITIDAGGKLLTMSKSVVDVAGTLQRVGVTSYTVRDAIIRLKDSGALLTGELTIIVAGLIAVAKYLGEVDAASKATNDDLIEMSHSGDWFKQAAATTEIFLNGQERLKKTLDDVNEKLKSSDRTYADYRSSIEATAKAAGYEIDAQGNLISTYDRGMGAGRLLIQTNYALSESEYAAGKAAHERGGIIDKGLQGLINLGRQINAISDMSMTATGATYKYADGMRALAEATQVGSDAQKEFREWIQKEVVAPKMEILNIGMSGAVKNEMKQFEDGQKTLQERLKDTADELRSLEREQGAVDKSTTKNAMSSAQLEQAQARLASTQAQLAKETDPGKQRELAASIAVQQEKISGANQAVVTYIDNSKRIADLKGQYADINAEIVKNADQHDIATKRIVFGYLQQELAAQGMTGNAAQALNTLAEKWGLLSKADIAALNDARIAAQTFAQDNSFDHLIASANAALADAKKPAQTVEEAAKAASRATGGLSDLVKGQSDKINSSLDSTKQPSLNFVNSAKDMQNQFDASRVKAMDLVNYGFNPMSTVLSTLTQQVSIFSQELGKIPGVAALLPTYAPPRLPSNPVERTYPGAQHGANFTVPSGYPNDTFPMRVSSGEHVQVTPTGQGGGQVPPINITQNFSGAESTPEKYKAIMYEVITNVFETAMRQ